MLSVSPEITMSYGIHKKRKTDQKIFCGTHFLGDFLVPARPEKGKLVGNRPSGSLSRSETKIYRTEFRAASRSS